MEDLREERRQVIEAILSLGHIPVGMELFQAGNDEQWSYISRTIEECDYFVVIVAERYGSTTRNGMSYTEKEYRYAVAQKVPVAALLLGDDSREQWPQRHCERPKRRQVNAFRSLCEKRLVQYWRSSDDLARKCLLALSALARRHPRPGWVPGTLMMDPAVPAELARLSQENARLARLVEEYVASGQSARATADRLRTVCPNRPDVVEVFGSSGAADSVLGTSAWEVLGWWRHGLLQQVSTEGLVVTFETMLRLKIRDTGAEVGETPEPAVRSVIERIVRWCLDELCLHGVVEASIEVPHGTTRSEIERLWRLTTLGKQVLLVGTESSVAPTEPIGRSSPQM